jgi:3-(3-hydroxy-phenyl)propionate hydroxylase
MQHKSASSEFDVVIVGRGPVGAALANLLGLCGVRTLVLEREARAYTRRAQCISTTNACGVPDDRLAEDILPHVI